VVRCFSATGVLLVVTTGVSSCEGHRPLPFGDGHGDAGIGAATGGGSTGQGGAAGRAGAGGGGSTGQAGAAGRAGAGGGGSTGQAGAGGRAGAGGSTGQGGAGGDSSLCAPTPWPAPPLITDFSDVTVPDGGFQYRIGRRGGLYSYGGATITVSAGALHVTGTITASTNGGAGVYFDDCVDATAFMGFKFTLTGTLGTCDMARLAALFPQDQVSQPGTGHGVCVGVNCYPPGSPYTIATTSVSFASMAGGGAVATVTPAAQARLTGVDFGFHGPFATATGAGGCNVDFTIDIVSFY